MVAAVQQFCVYSFPFSSGLSSSPRSPIVPSFRASSVLIHYLMAALGCHGRAERGVGNFEVGVHDGEGMGGGRREVLYQARFLFSGSTHTYVLARCGDVVPSLTHPGGPPQIYSMENSTGGVLFLAGPKVEVSGRPVRHLGRNHRRRRSRRAGRGAKAQS